MTVCTRMTRQRAKSKRAGLATPSAANPARALAHAFAGVLPASPLALPPNRLVPYPLNPSGSQPFS